MQPINRSNQKPMTRRLLLASILALFYSLAVASEMPVTLLESHGTLFEQQKDAFAEVKDAKLTDGWKGLRVGKEIDKDSLSDSPEKLAEAQTVLTVGERTLVTLSNGTVFEHAVSEEERLPLFNISGAAHFLTNKKEAAPPVVFLINHLKIQSQGSHFFYNSPGKTLQLTVLQGSVEITLPVEKIKPAEPKIKEKAPEANPAANTSGDAVPAETAVKPGATVATTDTPEKPEAVKEVREIVLETVKLSSMDRIIVEDKKYRIEKKVDPGADAFLQNSIVPGFEVPGPYRQSGKVEFKGEPLTIKRYGKTSAIKRSPALLMEGDEVQTADDQTAFIQLTDKDIIRLSQNTTFSINTYSFQSKSLTSLLGFSGKIRARIAKRKIRSQIRFKTATAVIGIKGTVFESNASAEGTTVETVQGTVGVSDPNGQGEVSVKAGEMTSVSADNLPTQPEPIPAERWQELQNGFISVAAASAVPLNLLRILSPADGQTYKTPVIQLEVDPEDATLIFQLDGQPLVAEDGDTLHYLSEGVHQLVVKGTSDAMAPQTVSFNIDKTAPVLLPETQLDNFILRQFQALNLIWSEPLATLNVSFSNTPVPTTISEDRKISVLDSSSLFVNTTNGQLIPLVFEATDKSGNNSRFEKSVQIKFRPTAPPVISIAGGKQSIFLKDDTTISTVSDRDIEQWLITLDQKPLSLPPVPQESQSDSRKKLLLIPSSHLGQLSEGNHSLTIAGTDDFGITARQTLELVVDRTPPFLQQPLTLLNPIQVVNESRLLLLDNLVVKEGESLLLNWSEPPSSVSVMLIGSGMLIPAAPTENMKTTKLDAAMLKQLLNSPKKSAIKVEATDAAGNRVQLQGNIQYLPKPKAPPLLTVDTVSGKHTLKSPDDVIIKSDRSIFQWQVFLNDREIVEANPKSPVSGSGSKQFQLQKQLFPELADGSHQITVKGIDRFNLNGSGELTITIDGKGPELVQLSKSIKLSSFKLRQDEMLQLKWSETLSSAEAILDDKPWSLPLSSDKATVMIKGDADKLSYKPKTFKLTATDLVGNTTQIQGRIALRKPRKMALQDSFNETILGLTGNSIDSMTLTNRPEFQLNNAQPVVESDNHRLLEKIEFRQNVRTEFFDYLDEPLTNSY